MAKIPGETAARIDSYVTKYMNLLGVPGSRPSVKVVNKSKSDRYAETEWRSDRPHKTVIRLPKKLFKFKSDSLLEQVIAHEMVHHRDFTGLTEEEITRWAESGVPPERLGGSDTEDEHGPAFVEGAKRINAIMGPDFVTPTVVGGKPKEPAFFQDLGKITSQVDDLSTKVMLVLGLGGLSLLGVAWLLRKQRSEAQGAPGMNERGSYGNR